MALKLIASRVLEGNSSRLMAIYSAMLLLFFHSFTLSYINSSFLAQFLSRDGVGPIYIIASSLTVFIFLFISRVLRLVGNYKITVGLLVVNTLAVIGMGFSGSLQSALPFFLLHIISLPLILFNLDVFLEAIIGNRESTTGSKRGLLLAFISFIGAVTPLMSGFVVETNGFSLAYFISVVPLVPIFGILFVHFRYFKDPKYTEIKLLSAIRSFFERESIRLVFYSNLLLRIFFTFNVIFVPLYFATEIGLGWSQIGLILFFGQLAYVVFEYPIGFIADAYIGEKEMMAAGFLILALSVPLLSVITTTTLLPWMIAMFVMRIGASLVEVTTESYFFKHTKSSDAQIISFFRLTRPLSFVIGGFIGSMSLVYLPFNLIFVVLGLFMVLGIICALSIADTK